MKHMCNTICINVIKKNIGHVENLSQHFLPHLNFLGPNFPSRFRFNITHSPRQSDESVLKMTSSELGLFTFFRFLIKMKTFLIILSLAAIFIARSVDGAFVINPNQGLPCSSAANCGDLNFCCVGPQGKYCAKCCRDSDCPPILGEAYICLPGYNYLYKGPQHSQICQPANVQVPKGPCFRNDMCQSGTCNQGLGFSGDMINLPLGRCV